MMRSALGRVILTVVALVGGAPVAARATMLVATPESVRQHPLPALLILPSGEGIRTFAATRALMEKRGGPVVYDFGTGHVAAYRPEADRRLAGARPDTVLVYEPERGRLRPIRSATESVSARLSDPGSFVVLTDVASGSDLAAPPRRPGARTAALLATSICTRCPACSFVDEADPPFERLLDVDANGAAAAGTDAVYIARQLLGLTPVPPSFRLIDPTIPADATIAARITAAGTKLDIDQNGIVDVATDVVYIVRHLLLLTPVPPSFRIAVPTIPQDAVIAGQIDSLCSQ